GGKGIRRYIGPINGRCRVAGSRIICAICYNIVHVKRAALPHKLDGINKTDGTGAIGIKGGWKVDPRNASKCSSVDGGLNPGFGGLRTIAVGSGIVGSSKGTSYVKHGANNILKEPHALLTKAHDHCLA